MGPVAYSKFSEILEACKEEAVIHHGGATDSKTATAILLLAVIKADGLICRDEYAELVRILGDRFDMPAKELGELLERVSDTSSSNYNLDKFTQHLCETWDLEARLDLLGSFWQIALADKAIDERERDLIERLAEMLNLPSEKIIAARKRAEQMMPMG